MKFRDLELRAIRWMLPRKLKLELGLVDYRSALRNLKALGLRPAVIVDVGAYDGRWTLKTASIFPDARYVLFEAQASKAERIRKNLGGQISYELVVDVLGERDGQEVAFYMMETGSSYYEERTSYPRKQVKAITRTLDSLVPMRALEEEILLKLDTQGSELDILNGAERVLGKTGCILIETNVLEYNRGAPLVAGVMNYLDKKGFAPVDVVELHRRSYDQALIQMDLLFLRKDHAVLSRLNDLSRGI